MATRAKMLVFPQNEGTKKFNHHADEWLDLLYKFGDEMGPPDVQTLCLIFMPDNLRAEIYRRPELQRDELMRLIDGVVHQTMWEKSEELAAQPMRPEKSRALFYPRAPSPRSRRPPPPPTNYRRPRPQRRQSPQQAPREPNAMVAEFK